MPSKLSRWGNSLGIRIPSFIAERAGLAAGDLLYINLRDDGLIVIRPVKANAIPAGYAGLSQAAIPAESPKAPNVW